MSYENRGRSGGRSYGNRGGGYQRREPREMHDAVCSACGAKCQVPFKPSGDRPIYCRECYMKKRDNNLTDEQMMANKPAPAEKVVEEEAPVGEKAEEQ